MNICCEIFRLYNLGQGELRSWRRKTRNARRKGDGRREILEEPLEKKAI
jgi:transposase-like protein